MTRNRIKTNFFFFLQLFLKFRMKRDFERAEKFNRNHLVYYFLFFSGNRVVSNLLWSLCNYRVVQNFFIRGILTPFLPNLIFLRKKVGPTVCKLSRTATHIQTKRQTWVQKYRIEIWNSFHTMYHFLIGSPVIWVQWKRKPLEEPVVINPDL